MAQDRRTATLVIPAHNEERVLPRLLRLLLADADPDEFRIIVACNGCTDGTATAARSFGAGVDVLELPQPSKAAALEAAGRLAVDFPVIFIDADVAIDTAGIRALVGLLSTPDVHAAAPTRRLERAGVSILAGLYYDVWERLPQVRTGLFGRGVVSLSEAGYARVRTLPRYIADDAAFSDAFEPSEKAIADDAVVSVWPARTWRALVARRVRAVEGMRELRAAGASSDSSATHTRDLWAIVVREPAMALRMPVFLATTLAARAGERRRRSRGTTGWARDETSRLV